MADSTLAAEQPAGTSTPATPSVEQWNAKYQQARMARMNFERRWYTYLAFVSGKQYFQWFYDSSSPVGRMMEPANNSNRVRIVINKTRRILRKELAKINKEPVRGYIIPSNTDDNSQASARAAENLADYFNEFLKMQWRFKQADWWMLTCGTSFLKIYYDEQIPMGQAVVQQPQAPGMPPGPVTEQSQPLFGGPVIEPVDPFHILVPNLDEPDIQKQEWVMHVTMKSPEWVQQMYGIKLDGVSVSTNTLESRLLAIQGMTTENRAKAVEIREVWIKPNSTHEQGMRLVMTQDKMLEVDEGYPYEHGQYPFVKRQYIENSIFYGVTLVEDLIPLQVEYNRTRSQIIEDKNRMGRPLLALELGSVPNMKAIQGRAGEIIEYRPGSKVPEPIQLAGLPSYIIDHVNRIGAEMAELASQENQDGTNVPNGVTAATAIAYLQENQDALVADTIRDKEMAWEGATQQILALAAQFWDAQRMVTVGGKNGSFESFTFSKSDLAGQTNWHAVVGSATPQSYSAKQAQIMELMKMGAVPVPDALEYLDMGDTARLYEGMQEDKREAQKENIRMGNDVPVQVQLWQEHLHHLMEHDSACKREEYESWSQYAKAYMRYHVVSHMFMWLQEHGWNAPMVPNPATGQMAVDPNFIQLQQSYMEQGTIAAQSGQPPQVPPMLELALRKAMTELTMAPAAGTPTADQPPTPGGPPQ
jgi:hypothetical protein